jgi:ribosomal protein S6
MIGYCDPNATFQEVFMVCLEMQELEASNNQFNERSHVTFSLLSAGRGEFREWQRAGRARLAYMMLKHRETCNICRSQK